MARNGHMEIVPKEVPSHSISGGMQLGPILWVWFDKISACMTSPMTHIMISCFPAGLHEQREEDLHIQERST